MRQLIFILFLSGLSFGQGTDHQLAEHYYTNEEYDKAVVYYRKLYDSNDNKFYFNRLVECLIETGEDKEAEKVLKRRVAKDRTDQETHIQLAKFYENRGSPEKAEKIYTNLIDNLRASSRSVITLFNAFKAQGKSDLAYQTLLRGRKLLKKTYPLNFQFAEYYGSIGQTENMMNEYLDLLDYHPSYKASLQRVLSNQVDFSEEDSKEYEILKQALIERTQKHPSEVIYAEMLTWLFIQRQNFSAALVHVKGMDKRTKANGRLVYDLGNICVENKDYRTAKKAFKYVVELGEGTNYFMRSQNALLNVRFLEVTTLRNFSKEELNETVEAFNTALTTYGKKRSTVSLMMELAHIQAFYADQSVQAIDLLGEALEIPGLTDMQAAEIKMLLADIHVLDGDVWEASLLYMQVDKSFKYEAIGHEAKFKNARIFYYDGEFDFAQSQLDVLKRSTTKLIANDALKLSLLITDNYGMDSNYIAMNWFANADLLIEQHKFTEAFSLFDSIIINYPYHSLGDEIQLKKARAMQIQGKWNAAIEELEELLKFYPDDILADDALFQLGDIYENRLMNSEKAAGYYRQILFDHKGSLYTEEARKRFTKLRGSTSLKDRIEG
jgi:tetratricopeptide (TPR) repeat protein